MTTQAKTLKPLAQALGGDHTTEGIAILASEPWRFLHGVVYLTLALVLAALTWSFIGRADVIVTAPGALQPDSELRRVNTPVDGELANLYVAEGQPVAKGDVIARLNARGAIEAAANAQQAQLRLEDAEREWRQFPEKKALLERKAATLRQAMEVEEQQHARRQALGTGQVAEAQRAQMAEARTNVEDARRARDAARAEADKFERVFAAPGGSGVSQLQVEAKRNALAAAENALRVAQSRVGEIGARQVQELQLARQQVETSGAELARLRLQYEAATTELTTAEERVRTQLSAARVAAESAARVRFENIDKDNFLVILAPASGVITDIASTQPGDKVQANMPLAGIAPAGARPVVRIEIPEADRAFLREGQPVKLKFNAFPYQRYGLIEGTLEYISPATKPATGTKAPVYEGRVKLERDHYLVAEKKVPLRYGMTASAEVIVRQRRLIDLALDPLRQIGG
jgi:HlyD family secretion protein